MKNGKMKSLVALVAAGMLALTGCSTGDSKDRKSVV